MDGPIQWIVRELDDETRIDLFLSRKTGESRALIKEHIEGAKFRLNGKIVEKPATLLKIGDQIEGEITETLRESTLEPKPGNLEIVFEDADFLAINKAQGVVVHPAPGHQGDTLAHYLLHYLSQNSAFSSLSPVRPGIVHRLDRGTSGLILVAKNRSTQERLSDMFKERQIQKEYRCVVWGRTKDRGLIREAIGRDRVHRQKMSSKTTKGRAAQTEWNRLSQFAHFSYLQVLPKTGRTHQIRVHLSESGHPIVGDPLYGRGATAKRTEGLQPALRAQVIETKATFLHAYGLKFAHPRSGEAIELTAPLPAGFRSLLELLATEDIAP